jgi:DeoR/GlpR family transcriptional regulator of sugar metabolism
MGPDIPSRRREQIALYVKEVGAVRNEELAERFGVSLMTIHRDLDALSNEGWLEKTRGGARAGGLRLHERNVALRYRQNTAQKRAIARGVMSYLRPGMTIAMEDSTTTAALLPYFGSLHPMTLITNFLPAINAAAADPDIDLVSLGGQYDRNLDSFDGPAVIDQLALLNADVSILSAASVHKGWLLHPSPDTARRKKMLSEIGETRILMIDSSKFDQRASYRVGSIDNFDVVVTDSGISEAHLEELRQLSPEINVVDVLPEDITAPPLLGLPNTYSVSQEN